MAETHIIPLLTNIGYQNVQLSEILRIGETEFLDSIRGNVPDYVFSLIESLKLTGSQALGEPICEIERGSSITHYTLEELIAFYPALAEAMADGKLTDQEIAHGIPNITYTANEHILDGATYMLPHSVRALRDGRTHEVTIADSLRVPISDLSLKAHENLPNSLDYVFSNRALWYQISRYFHVNPEGTGPVDYDFFKMLVKHHKKNIVPFGFGRNYFGFQDVMPVQADEHGKVLMGGTLDIESVSLFVGAHDRFDPKIVQFYNIRRKWWRDSLKHVQNKIKQVVPAGEGIIQF